MGHLLFWTPSEELWAVVCRELGKFWIFKNILFSVKRLLQYRAPQLIRWHLFLTLLMLFQLLFTDYLQFTVEYRLYSIQVWLVILWKSCTFQIWSTCVIMSQIIAYYIFVFVCFFDITDFIGSLRHCSFSVSSCILYVPIHYMAKVSGHQNIPTIRDSWTSHFLFFHNILEPGCRDFVQERPVIDWNVPNKTLQIQYAGTPCI